MAKDGGFATTTEDRYVNDTGYWVYRDYTNVPFSIVGVEILGNVTLQNDVTINNNVSFDDIAINGDATLNLNGKTFDTAKKFNVNDGGTLSIDGTATGSQIKFTSCNIFVNQGGNLNVTGGTYTSNSDIFYVSSEGGTEAVKGGTINLKDVKATTTGTYILQTPDPGTTDVTCKYVVNVDGGTYTSSSTTGANQYVFMIGGAQGNFNGVTIDTKIAGAVQIAGRHDVDTITAEAAPSTPNATFEDCNFTITGPSGSSTFGTSIISVSEGAVAQIKSGTYTANGEAYGLYVFSSNGGFIIDGGNFVNNTTADHSMITQSYSTSQTGIYDGFAPFTKINNGDFSQGSNATSSLVNADQVSGTTAETNVTGGKYKENQKTEVGDYVDGALEVNEYGEVVTKGGEWKQVDSTTTWQYCIGESNETVLLTVEGVTNGDSLKGDKATKYLAVPSTATNITWAADSVVPASLKGLYQLAKYSAAEGAVTIEPVTEGFRIADSSFITSIKRGTTDVTTLTASGNIGIYVDASGTDLALTSIVGGAGNDTFKAGARATTLDGGAGDDKLIGNTAADTFIYSGGNDTIDGFGTSDKFSLASGFSPITDGSKISGDVTGFNLAFSDGNTLTFTGATPATLKYGTNEADTYSYTREYVEKGKYATLAAGVTSFNMGTDINSVNASAVTGALNITDNSSNNYIIAGQGANTFNITGGKDTISGYTYGTDVVNVTNAPTTNLTEISYDTSTSKFVIKLGDGTDSLTFESGVSEVELGNGADTYYYKNDRVIVNDSRVTLGSLFNNKAYNVASGTITSIDASAVTTAVNITGNSENANSIIGAQGGGNIIGGEGNDILQAGGGSTTLNGGEGNDSLKGSGGADVFVYNGGKDTISGYANGDFVNVRNYRLSEATVSVGTPTDNKADISLSWGDTDNLIFEGIASDAAVTVRQNGSSTNTYTYSQNYFAHNKSVTLAADYNQAFDGNADANKEYVTINAAAVNNAISVMGNSLNNYIFGPTAQGGTLNGGSGNDRIDVNERGASAKYVFEHDAGKDEVFGFNQSNDSLKIAVESITAAKAGNSRLTLTIAKDNSVVLRGDDDITKVSIQGSTNYLTKDGYVTTADKTLKLFSSAKGRIDLGDDPYKTSTITAVDATSVEKQSVTLVGGTQGGTFTYATGNKKRDGFVYGGGNVKIVNYEASKDRIDLNAATFSSFEVGTNTDTGVKLTTGSGTISITGAAGQEVLLRNGGSRSFKKMVFAQTGVLQNKSKNPTSATVSGAAGSYSVGTDKASIKKIYVEGITTANGIQINAGNKNNTIIDASKAEKGVTLSGGNKNDKLIGNTVSSAADTFIYGAGKDIIQNFSADDTISMATFNASVGSAKITAGSKSIKFKFSNKNTLTVKATKGESLSGALNIVSGETNTSNTYAKNAIADSTNNKVTLTDKFSGTFKTVGTKGLDGITVETVDGSKVTKNLTFKGSEANESLTGGKKKNTFKGGGGDDTLTGGANAKDIFFYAKGDKGHTTIANFEFGANKDRLKIASGTIGEISTVTADGKTTVQFAMNSGKKGDTSNIGWFNVETTNATSGKDIAIKANNTYYWFADGTETIGTGDDTLKINSGQLITSDTRVSSGDVSNFDILELNYSTNLAKSGVAVKVTGATPNKTNS